MALLRDDQNVSLDSRARARSHLALFRLIPWLRPPRRRDEDVDTYFYTECSGQNPFEIWSVSLCFNLTWMCLICGAISHYVEIHPTLWPFVFAASSLATVVLIVIILGLAEPFARWMTRTFDNLHPATVHSSVQLIVLLVVSVEASFDAHWVKWAGRVWIALVALELMARLVELVFSRRAEPSAG